MSFDEYGCVCVCISKSPVIRHLFCVLACRFYKIDEKRVNFHLNVLVLYNKFDEFGLCVWVIDATAAAAVALVADENV